MGNKVPAMVSGAIPGARIAAIRGLSNPFLVKSRTKVWVDYPKN